MLKNKEYSSLWAFFDKIYCINLQERSDRQFEAKNEFIAVGLADKVEFFTVKKHPVDCEQGIFESHFSCIKRGLQENAKTIVIFEDDIIFDRFNADTLKGCIDFMASDKNWNILFFGCLVKKSEATDCRSVVKIKYRSLSHGYVISRRFAEKIVKYKWENISYDGFLDDIQDNFYAAYPSFAFQSNSKTDNSKYLKLDRFRRVFGGLESIQKMNEFFFRHPVAVISVHLFLISLLILLLKY